MYIRLIIIYLGPIENDNILDFLFGISIVIILLNVIIAIVIEAWEDASEEANKAFWSYRLDLILEKTRGVEEDGFFRASFCRCFVEIDDYYINHHTVGTTVTELKAKLALRYREKGVFSCLVIITKSLGWVILGFPTFGFLWVSTRIMCASIKLRTSFLTFLSTSYPCSPLHHTTRCNPSISLSSSDNYCLPHRNLKKTT